MILPGPAINKIDINIYSDNQEISSPDHNNLVILQLTSNKDSLHAITDWKIAQRNLKKLMGAKNPIRQIIFKSKLVMATSGTSASHRD